MFTTPPTARQEKTHKGRWFAAGFITGWVVKQHFANKKLRAQEAAHTKVTEAQGQKIDTLEYNQYHADQKLKRTEGNLQTTQNEQAKAQRAAAAAESARLNQAQHARAEQAAAQSRAGSAPEQAAGMPLTAAEQAVPFAAMAANRAPAPAAEQRPFAAPSMETPLQHAAAEIPFGAAAAAQPSAEGRPSGQPFAAETAPKAVPAAERPPQTAHETAQELVAQAYNLQPGQHIEHATGGGHNIIVDKHGHEVQNAMEYGEEFQFQRRQEQLRSGAFANDSSQGGQGASQDYSNGIITGLGIGSGQVNSDHDLPSGALPTSIRKRLQSGKRENPIVATVASPWLWASMIVLIIAFFIAAFI
jgi:hypothetical protein